MQEKERKTASKPWFRTMVLVSPASNQNQNQLETMNMVWFGFSKPWFWFAGLLV
jgi:hypothetical protein